MLTRHLRKLLLTVDFLDRGTGVTLNRIVHYMRSSFGFIGQANVISTLHRAVRQGYLRVNNETGRYYPHRASWLALLPRELPRQNNDEIELMTSSDEESVEPTVPPYPLLPIPGSVRATRGHNGRRNHRAVMRNRNTFLRPTVRVIESIPAAEENSRDRPVTPRRVRFGQSLMLNVMSLIKSEGLNLNLETKELTEVPIKTDASTDNNNTDH